MTYTGCAFADDHTFAPTSLATSPSPGQFHTAIQSPSAALVPLQAAGEPGTFSVTHPSVQAWPSREPRADTCVG